MPIRINLLSEAQAQEEQRRKDPVKRAGLVAGLIVLAVAGWSGSLQWKVIRGRGGLNGLESKWKSIEAPYKSAVEARRQSIDTNEKLTALHSLHTNRFLWGTALNGLQQAFKGMEEVNVVRLKTEQHYAVTDAVQARPGDPKSGRTASATEKITMTIEAVDSSAQPGSQVGKFKDTLASVPWFASTLQKTNGVLLNSLSAPQISPTTRTPFVTFTLNCYFPVRVR